MAAPCQPLRCEHYFIKLGDSSHLLCLPQFLSLLSYDIHCFSFFPPLDTFQDPKIAMPAEQRARTKGGFNIRVQNTHEMDLALDL